MQTNAASDFQISDANDGDISAIIKIAYATWPETYGKILSTAQLDFMLGLFYSEAAIRHNQSNGQHFLIVRKNSEPVAFAAYQNQYADKTTHVHKIYILPHLQGHGLGKILMGEIENRAKMAGANYLTLNVNRFNSAQNFYKKLDFSIVREVDIVLDHGYLMEDYIMQKLIS